MSATAVTAVRTSPDHDSCTRHRRYMMNCHQFEGLIKRSGGVCEICRRLLAKAYLGKLAIDHRGPLWAVRGLLCNGCNNRLGDDNSDFEGAAEYLENAWWKQQCKALGLPTWRQPEPPIGSAIRNQWGILWVHTEEDSWWAPTQDGHGWPRHTWGRLYDSYGPHNLAPVDLREELAANTLPSSVDYALRTAECAADVRVTLGLPEPFRTKGREWSPRDSLPWLATPERTAAALRVFLTPEECLRVAELLTPEGA